MTSNLVVRNKQTGYVTFVGRERVDGQSRTTKYHCGLGTMDQAEFKAFQKWAHSIKDQEMRVQMVLANPKAVEEKQEVTKKVAAEAQKKTTVKRAKKVTVVKDKYTPEEREAERKRFRKEYEEKKRKEALESDKKVKRTVKIVSDGIRFTGRRTIGERRAIIDKRITQLKLHIENTKFDLRSAARRSEKWRTPDRRIADWKEKIGKYEEAVRILKNQRAELRR